MFKQTQRLNQIGIEWNGGLVWVIQRDETGLKNMYYKAKRLMSK